MTQQRQIREWVRTHLIDSFLDGDTTALADDDDLLAVLNSLELLRMVLDLEGEFTIQIDNSELSPENLGTVRRIAAFVAQKTSAAGRSHDQERST